ncbi:MAG: hypothetical protein ACOH2J_07665 [Allorhizobium sp.]
MTTLTEDQLIALVQVRGQALEFNATADRKFLARLQGPNFQGVDLEQYVQEKEEILLSLMKAEEMIIDGGDETAN